MRPRSEGRRRQIELLVGSANVAAVIAEPIQGEGGFIVPTEGFLSGGRMGSRA